MALIKQKAIVLRTINYSETSKIVILLSEHRGLIKLIAKGVRKSKSRLSGVIEPLNSIEALYYSKENRELHTLNDASIIHAPVQLRLEAEDVMLALACCEMLTRIEMPENTSSHMFKVLETFIQKFEKENEANRRMLFLIFQLHMIYELGIAPDLGSCSLCGSKESKYWKVLFSEGKVACDQCDEYKNDNTWIEEVVRATLVYFMYSSLNSLTNIENYAKIQKHIYGFIQTYYQFHLEEMLNLKSMAVLQKMKQFKQEMLKATSAKN